MNISRLPKKISRYLLLGVMPFLAVIDTSAQSGGVEHHSLEVMIGDTLYFDFFSDPPYAPKIEQYGVFPQHGTADLPGSGPLGVAGWNTLTYIPTTTTPVQDVVYIQYWKFENNMYFSVNMTIDLLVLPSILHAVDDYAETDQDQSVIIDVLANDYGTGDTIRISDIPLVNSGQVVMNGQQTLAMFMPTPGFSGLAHFNYTICDEDGSCDVATVTVAVMPNVMQTYDTLRLTTAKNTPREILLPLDGWTLSNSPDHGSLDSTSAAYLIYTPTQDYADGYDDFTFTKTDGNGTYQLHVIMHVLDLPEDNTFVFDDYAYTILDQSVEVDVLANDLGGNSLMNVGIISQPSHGTAVNLGNGIFEYTPNAGYAGGMDVFRYRAFSPNGTEVEYGKVYVTVSNQVPSQGTFALSTPMDVPLVIGYNIPIFDYNFSVIVDPDFGTVDYHPGFNSLTINGQTFEGYNMLIYTPDPGISGLVDEFEIEYCVVSDQCPTAIVKIDVEILDVVVSPDQYCLGENCVWAGDTNSDGVVDMNDILPLGMCMGESGAPRPNPDFSQWFGQYGDDWNNIQDDPGFDLKHIDADGDGIISGLDTAAITQFYLNKHSLTPEPVDNLIQLPLYFYETSVEPVEGGDLVHLDIWLGDPNDVIAEDMYGFTFSLDYEPDLVIPSSVQVNFLQESWMTYNSPVLHLTKKPFDGRIDAGYSRTSGISENGYGIVASLDFVIIEDIDGGRLKDDYIDIDLHNARMMNSAGQVFRLPGSSIRIPFRQIAEETESSPAKLLVYPNPADQYLSIHLNGSGKEIEYLSVHTITGERIYTVDKLKQKHLDLYTDQMVPGLYVIHAVATDGSVLTEKFEVFH